MSNMINSNARSIANVGNRNGETIDEFLENLRQVDTILTSFGVYERTVDELMEAGVVQAQEQRDIHTLTTMVSLVLQNNRRHDLRVVEVMHAGAIDTLFKNAIGICVMLNSLPPVDLQENVG